MDGRLPLCLGRDGFLMVCEVGDYRKRQGYRGPCKRGGVVVCPDYDLVDLGAGRLRMDAGGGTGTVARGARCQLEARRQGTYKGRFD